MAYKQEVENIRTMLNSGLADATTIEQLKKREADMKNIIFLIYISIMKTIMYKGLRPRSTYEEK